MSSYALLAGGYRASIARLSFTPSSCGGEGEFKLVSESPTPPNPSWVEAFPSTGVSISRAYSISEDDEGLAFSLKVTDEGVEVTSKQKTHGGPCHVHVLSDRSGIVVANYMGGSLTLHSLREDGTLAPSQAYSLPFAYEGKTAPNKERQDASHAHGVIELRGLLYAADLGSDRVYVLKRIKKEGGEGLEVVDWIQCEPGFGPRHCVVSKDEFTIFILGEMGHTVAAYPLPSSSNTTHKSSKALWTQSYLPPSVPKEYTKLMDGAEIALHPNGKVIYASNRLELHAAEKNGLPELASLGEGKGGDAVAIIHLDGDDGKRVGKTQWVRTECCCVRGMQVSPDGKYVAVAGQCNSTAEVYEISEEGTEWTKVASLEIKGVTDFAWI